MIRRAEGTNISSNLKPNSQTPETPITFVTLFDQSYLPHGLVLIQSIKRHHPTARVCAIAMDEEVEFLLLKLGTPGLEIIPIAEFANAQLEFIAKARSISEYCWTSKPFAALEVFKRNPLLETLVLIDANMYLLSKINNLLVEFEASDKNSMIFRHDYTHEYNQTDRSGEFSASLIFFRRSALSSILPDWGENCLRWCGDTPEHNLFADQKYLEGWLDKFDGEIAVSTQDQLLGAPWNISNRNLSELCIYKFQSLRIVDRGKVLLTDCYRLDRIVISEIYTPYVSNLFDQIKRMELFGRHFSLGEAIKDRRRTRALTLALMAGRLRASSPYLIEAKE